MKNSPLTRLTSCFLLLTACFILLASCGTQSNNPSNARIGTWKGQNAWSSALWVGGDKNAQPVAVASVTRYAMQVDSTSSDSLVTDSTVTMVYPNSDFSVQMTPPSAFNLYNHGNIAIQIIDHQIPPLKGISIQFDSTQASLGSNFSEYFGLSFASLTDGGYKLVPTYQFDCNQPIQLTNGNLRYIVKVMKSDSSWVVFQYNLRLKGVQQAAQRVACN